MLTDLHIQFLKENCLKEQIDLLEELQTRKLSGSDEAIEAIVNLNLLLWRSMSQRDFWEIIGEKMLRIWGFDVPQQKKSEDGKVLLFWDAKRGETYYSVKTSFKGPLKRHDQALKSSNIEFSSLLSALCSHPDDQIGTLGCVYKDISPVSKIISWGDAYTPERSSVIFDRTKSLVEDYGGSEGPRLFEEIVSGLSSKRMGSETAKRVEELQSALKASGLLSSHGRITYHIEDFFGAPTNKEIASIKIYDPLFLWSSAFGIKGIAGAKQERMHERLKIISWGLSEESLQLLIGRAKELLEGECHQSLQMKLDQAT
jgi:hypothetical protein